MSTTYKTVSDDTFESIARKSYGTEQQSSLISQANPGVLEPLIAGLDIVIPTLPNAPRNVSFGVPSNDVNEVAILINGERFRFWSSVRIVRALDVLDIVEFEAPFDADLAGFREGFRPFSYAELDISVGSEVFFTGTLVSSPPVVTPNQRIITVSAYSLPGILNDCTPPASMFPNLEFSGQSLAEIAATLSAPFGITTQFDTDSGGIFDLVRCKPTRKVLDFLNELARQRNLITSNTVFGALRFYRSIETGKPVARLELGSSPVVSVTPTFSPQQYYSHITGLEPVVEGLEGSQFTVANTRLQGVVRPFTFVASDVVGGDIKAAVEAKAARMYGNAVAYDVQLSTWRDSSGTLWEPNTLVGLIALDAMIYTEYTFLIRSVDFRRDTNSESAILNLVIPGSFSGVLPESLPWDT